MSVTSPCNSICKMDENSGLCLGCWRTIDEIVAWSSDSDEKKKKVWSLIALRKNEAMNRNSNFNEIDKAP
jgi:uncharacterized protein